MASMTPEELQFIAENYQIMIIPNFRMESLSLVDGSIERLTPNVPAKVPLWFAVILKTHRRCRIRTPHFLNKNYLQDLIKREKEERECVKIHTSFIEISNIIIKHAPDDISNVSAVKSLIEDLRVVRINKVRNRVLQISGNESMLKITNVSFMEMNAIKPLLIKGLNVLYKLRDRLDVMEEARRREKRKEEKLRQDLQARRRTEQIDSGAINKDEFDIIDEGYNAEDNNNNAVLPNNNNNNRYVPFDEEVRPSEEIVIVRKEEQEAAPDQNNENPENIVVVDDIEQESAKPVRVLRRKGKRRE